ncbi:hypothetical protein M9H77_36949 [Catharanthus roseus]|uniref:Uncharacterized protein n=1 Tax=Catharanthus roseus TaxID=4058 RepID=A0ACB9ZTB3_CATRO|nr:hypothetical protein M9H77_36949 [Catharanthus roseus]
MWSENVQDRLSGQENVQGVFPNESDDYSERDDSSNEDFRANHFTDDEDYEMDDDHIQEDIDGNMEQANYHNDEVNQSYAHGKKPEGGCCPKILEIIKRHVIESRQWKPAWNVTESYQVPKKLRKRKPEEIDREDSRPQRIRRRIIIHCTKCKKAGHNKRADMLNLLLPNFYICRHVGKKLQILKQPAFTTICRFQINQTRNHYKPSNCLGLAYTNWPGFVYTNQFSRQKATWFKSYEKNRQIKEHDIL